MVSSFKLWTLAVFQGAGPRHLQASLDEYCYRLSRRDKREDLFRRALDRCLLYTGPAPHSLLADTRANGMVMDGGQTAIASVLCDMDAASTALCRR